MRIKLRGRPQELYWLPEMSDWRATYQNVVESGETSWAKLVSLSNARLDFLQTTKLDRLLQRKFPNKPPAELTTRPVRLAILGSSTTDHLFAGIRVAALRRNIWLKTYAPDYGQYLAELLDPNSNLSKFEPDAFLCALDA